MVAIVAKDYDHVNPTTDIDQGLEYRIDSPTISALEYFDLISSYLFLARYNHV
ncbi:hypothetical protein BH18THE2_BH18THE2_43200 [soil metagenome]